MNCFKKSDENVLTCNLVLKGPILEFLMKSLKCKIIVIFWFKLIPKFLHAFIIPPLHMNEFKSMFHNIQGGILSQ